MALPAILQHLALPVVGSPMFIVSYPELVLAQCKAGIVGSFPALNARPAGALDEWLTQIQAELAAHKAANPDAVIGPIAVNQIVHQSNARLEEDVHVCVDHKVPIFITSLRAPVKEMIAVHAYGGIVLHDVINLRHAQKALEAGVDGPIVLSGAIANGGSILAAQAMGADLVYGHALYRDERGACAGQLQTGDRRFERGGHYLHESVYGRARELHSREHREHGPRSGRAARLRQNRHEFLRWHQQGESVEGLWGAGQGVGLMEDVPSVAELVARLKREYDDAKSRLISPAA